MVRLLTRGVSHHRSLNRKLGPSRKAVCASTPGLTFWSLHVIIHCTQCPNLDHIPLPNADSFALILPLIASEGAPCLNGPVFKDVYAQRGKGVRRTLDGEEVAAGRDVAEVEGVFSVQEGGVGGRDGCEGGGGRGREGRRVGNVVGIGDEDGEVGGENEGGEQDGENDVAGLHCQVLV